MKQKLQFRNWLKTPARAIFLTVAVIAMVFGGFSLRPTSASIQDQINALEAENAANREKVANLEDQAVSYEDAINKLAAKINAVQAKINSNVEQQAKLKKKIAKAEKELEIQKDLLGQNIRVMYVEGDFSTLEMLASSKDLSEFVDKQQYRSSVQNKIKETLDKITELRHQLVAQKEQVELLLKEQRQQQSELATSRDKQRSLLSYNEGQQAAFNRRTRANEAKIQDLIASQRRSNFSADGGYYFLRFPGAVKNFSPGAYPYRNGGFGMSEGPGCVDNDGPDPWGYCTRQCVSYAAWAVKASGRNPPMYYGNARDWVAAAYARGIPVYRTPKKGDIAISTSGFWGHAMYVEGVGGGRSFTTSEYNASLSGELSYQTRSY